MGGDEAQDPDFMAGLEHGLGLRRFDPARPPAWAAEDVVKALKAKGRDPDLAKVLAGVERGLRGPEEAH
jgi:hypothetical protein